MSFWSRLFDAPDAVSKGMDAVISAGDALIYTSEEKAADGLKRLDWLLNWAKTTTGQNLARRLIALAITAVWLLEAIVTCVLCVWAALKPEIQPAADAISAQFARMSTIELILLTYYFVPNKIGEAVAKARSKQ